MPHHVFVYGTLKQGGAWHHLLDTANRVGTGVTDRPFPLLVGRIPYLLPEPDLGHRVQGEVYEVDDATLATLDALEQHPNWYERHRTEITTRWDDLGEPLGGVIAWTYFLTPACYAHIDWRAMPMHASYPIVPFDLL